MLHLTVTQLVEYNSHVFLSMSCHVHVCMQYFPVPQLFIPNILEFDNGRIEAP